MLSGIFVIVSKSVKGLKRLIKNCFPQHGWVERVDVAAARSLMGRYLTAAASLTERRKISGHSPDMPAEGPLGDPICTI